jgi:hypothetical protein
MSVIELLEATKVQADQRWGPQATLWGDECCILGCLGYARWGEEFITGDYEDEGYRNLKGDPDTAAAVEALAKNSHIAAVEGIGPPLEMVYRQNDTHLRSKQDVKDFIDEAIADLKYSQSPDGAEESTDY